MRWRLKKHHLNLTIGKKPSQFGLTGMHAVILCDNARPPVKTRPASTGGLTPDQGDEGRARGGPGDQYDIEIIH